MTYKIITDGFDYETEADSAKDALDIFAKDAGYEDYAGLCAAVGDPCDWEEHGNKIII